MLGDGTVSFGVRFVAFFKNVKSSAKIVFGSPSLPISRAAVSNAISSVSLRISMRNVSSDLLTPPSW